MELDAQARQDDSVVDPDAHPDDGADKRNHDHDQPEARIARSGSIFQNPYWHNDSWSPFPFYSNIWYKFLENISVIKGQ